MRLADHVSPALLADLDQAVTQTAALVVIDIDGSAELHVKEYTFTPEAVADILRGIASAIDAACGGGDK